MRVFCVRGVFWKKLCCESSWATSQENPTLAFYSGRATKCLKRRFLVFLMKKQLGWHLPDSSVDWKKSMKRIDMYEASEPFDYSQREIEDWYMFDNETTENQSTTLFEYILTTQTSWIEGETGVNFWDTLLSKVLLRRNISNPEVFE